MQKDEADIMTWLVLQSGLGERTDLDRGASIGFRARRDLRRGRERRAEAEKGGGLGGLYRDQQEGGGDYYEQGLSDRDEVIYQIQMTGYTARAGRDFPSRQIEHGMNSI